MHAMLCQPTCEHRLYELDASLQTRHVPSCMRRMASRATADPAASHSELHNIR